MILANLRRPFILLAALLAVELALAAQPSASREFTPEAKVQAVSPRGFLPIVTMWSGPPLMATSYYIDTIDTGTHYALGCSLGQRDLGLPGAQTSIVVLDFGMPKQQGNEFGTSIFSFSFASNIQIATAAQYFMQGYWDCSATDQESQLMLAIGTTNYGSQVTYQHGQSWADMVNLVGDWLIDTGYIAQMRVAGANDIELAWNSPTTTRAWVDGYTENYMWRYYDYGAAEGCPPYGDCGTSSYPEWTQEDAWYKAWGAPPAYPLPEIYLTSGGNAQQWYRLSLYGYQNHGARMDIGGSLTQYQACQQRGCNPLVANTPQQGWMQLWAALNNDSLTAQDLLWSADIKWLDASAGAAPLGAPGPAAADEQQVLQQALAGPVEGEARQSLEEKLEIVERESQARALAQALDIPKPLGAAAAAPTAAPEVERPAGIFEDVQGPFSSQELVVANAWQGQIDGEWVQVYAGALTDDPTQGVVVVLVAGQPGAASGSQHLTPAKAGAVRIVAAEGTRLTLEAADGTRFTFDAATRQFTTP
jgi:hypothetical protein